MSMPHWPASSRTNKIVQFGIGWRDQNPDPNNTLAEQLDEAAARSQRRGALAMAILALENAARLSSTRVARTERLLRAAGFAADLGQPETVGALDTRGGPGSNAAAPAGAVCLAPED